MARSNPPHVTMHSRRRDATEVSCAIKYLVFGFNVLFWLFGGLICATGLWAWSEKDMFTNIGKVTSIPLDPALIFIIGGAVVFLIGFTGCVGALRENTVLLLIYCICVGIVLFAELAIGIVFFVYKKWYCVLLGILLFGEIAVAVIGFVYKGWVVDQVQTQLKIMIVNYRDDSDLQNLIDWVQADWLKCCGVQNYNDWDANIYFNCTSPSRERCGVPYSCCLPKSALADDAIVNYQCGYDARNLEKTLNPETEIYTKGCVKAGEEWFNTNLIPIAGVAVGIALVQILGICFAQNLRSDIFAQMGKWRRN